MPIKPHRNYIHSGSWDVLIVLDACRFDFFQALNPFAGRLTKLMVKSSSTLEWYEHYFPHKYPYVYVSGNPTCCSRVRLSSRVFPHGFLCSEHFEKVVDVWDFGWSEKFKTVLPQTVTKASMPYLKEKVIIHYMQPHFPSIGKHRIFVEAWKPNPFNLGIKGLTQNYAGISNEVLREAYEENLQIVLKEIERLLAVIPPGRKIVITADHGELLGENGMYSHPVCFKHPLLNTVPWFDVE